MKKLVNVEDLLLILSYVQTPSIHEENLALMKVISSLNLRSSPKSQTFGLQICWRSTTILAHGMVTQSTMP